MQLGEGGEYSLAVHHSDEEMLEWGLSQQMINDQKCRAKGLQIGKCQWYLDGFFDHVDTDSDDGDKGVGATDKIDS